MPTATVRLKKAGRKAEILQDALKQPGVGFQGLIGEIRAALDASASLVVVCSATAAESDWVRREIVYFRSRYPDRPVLPDRAHAPALPRDEPAPGGKP